MSWQLILAASPFYIATASAVYAIFNRKARNACRQADHSGCEHSSFVFFASALFPVTIVIGTASLIFASIVFVGLQVGRTPTERRTAVEHRRKAFADYREAQQKAAIEEAEIRAWGVRSCRYCGTNVIRLGGLWRDKTTREMSCGDWNNRSRTHQIAEELDNA